MLPSVTSTLYRRPLPADLVPFSSPEGKSLFREALAAGGMEGWFPLAEQFHTQADPAYCGLGSLVVALNALGIDPQRLWKGPWRWFSEELLDCCVSLEQVRARGLTLIELGCLARCNGATAAVHHAEDTPESRAALRGDVAAAAGDGGTVVIVAYDRRELGQTGGGHFSPLGGFHAERDASVILDVARFKYPPHWVALDRLHRAMLARDPDTGRARGWIVLARSEKPGGLLLSLTCKGAAWPDVVAMFERPRRRWEEEQPRDAKSALGIFAAEVAALEGYTEWRAPVDDAHAASVAQLRSALEESPAGRALGAGPLAAALFYALAPEELAPLNADVRAELERLARLDHAELVPELVRLREQIAALRSYTR
jgi:glutathione gamma-glutamylcysteinyltransferase